MTADRNDTRKRLEAVANEIGIYIDGWSPGDGATRYRFIDTHGIAREDWNQSQELSYFGATGSRTLYTALGLADAWSWLRGYMAGARRDEMAAQIDRNAEYVASWSH